jgi:hypothetical protein
MSAPSLSRIACLTLGLAGLPTAALADPGSALSAQTFSARPANLAVSPSVFRQLSADATAKPVPITTKPTPWSELQDNESPLFRSIKTVAAVALLAGTAAVSFNRKSTCYVNASPGDCVR